LNAVTTSGGAAVLLPWPEMGRDAMSAIAANPIDARIRLLMPRIIKPLRSVSSRPLG
jgi:hypothetical protein